VHNPATQHVTRSVEFGLLVFGVFMMTNALNFAGKVRVIDLWASWCGPCRMTIPELNTLYDQYREKGLVVVGLSVDDNPADVLDFQRNVPMRYPSGMFNRGLAARIGEPSSIPTTLLIDRKGVLRKTFVGYVDVGTLEPLVRALL